MIIRKEIREILELKIKLSEELKSWFKENIDVDGCDISNVRICNKPAGVYQSQGEYCDQTMIGEDWYKGQYYWQMDNGKYLCMDFEIY